MSLRNPNIGIVVAGLVMLVGCWLAGWELSDGAAAAIVTAAFAAGLGTLLVLDDRDERRGIGPVPSRRRGSGGGAGHRSGP